MKKIFFLLACLLVTQLHSQKNISSTEWQEDLRYLQHKIHDDYQTLFLKTTKEDFDREIETLHKNIPNLKNHEIIVGIAKIVASFGYGHTALWLSSWRYGNVVNFHQLPINFYWFKEGIYIQGAHKDYRKEIGAKLIKINGIPVEEVLKIIKPTVSVENDQFFKAHGLLYLGVPELLHAKGIISDMSSVRLTLEKNNEIYNQIVTPQLSTEFPGNYGFIQNNEYWLSALSSQNEPPLWLNQLDKRYYFEYLAKNKTVYVRQSRVDDDPSETLSEFYKRVFDFVEKNDVERFILDLRLNSGGNNSKNKPVVTGLIKSEKINRKGKLFVITGRRTFSAAQNLVNELETYTESIFVGEPTAENVNFFGDNIKEKLPNSRLVIRLSYLWWQDKDARDKRQWTAPHIAIDLSYKDYINGEDPVVKNILNLSDKDLELFSSNFFTSRNTKKIKILIQQYLQDSRYRYFDFENRINEEGYDLINLGFNKKL